MTSQLGLETVAEGVESTEQQEFLQATGIDALQGHLHLPPATLAEFTAWLAGQPPLLRRRGAHPRLSRPAGVLAHTGPCDTLAAMRA